MKGKLIVISVLLLLATSACVPAAAPEDPPSARTPYPVIRLAPPNVTITPLSAVQEEAALHIVATSDMVEQINGGQDWEAYQFWATEIDGVSVIEVYVRWEVPVESLGPWQSLVCRNTQIAVTPALIKDITRMQVLVDMDRDAMGKTTTFHRYYLFYQAESEKAELYREKKG